MNAPLSGIRVVDLTATFTGPYCTLMLADLGADVIKIEPPAGDVVRNVGARRHDGMAAAFLHANRGKRSVVLDLKQPDGRAALDRLIAGADVFVHNMRPKAAEALGVDGTTVCDRNPRVVYCQLHGASVKGPYGNMPAYDDVVQAVSGIAAHQGAAEGRPRYVSTVMADKTVGVVGAYAVLAALFQREQTGRGQVLDVPMFETMVSFLLLEQLDGLSFDPPVGGPGYARTLSPYRRPHATADGYISVMVYTDSMWSRFFEFIDRPDLVADPRFADITARTDHTDELYQLLGAVLEDRSTSEWLEILKSLDIPAMPVNSIEDLLDDPHLTQVGLFKMIDHPSEGRLRSMGFPIDFSDASVGSTMPAPLLGQHSSEVLAECGYSDGEIAGLIRAGVTISGPGDRSATA